MSAVLIVSSCVFRLLSPLNVLLNSFAHVLWLRCVLLTCWSGTDVNNACSSAV